MKYELLICFTLISCQLSELGKSTESKIETTFWNYHISKKLYYSNGSVEFDTSFIDEDNRTETIAVGKKLFKIERESTGIDCYRETEFKPISGGDPFVFYYEDPTYGIIHSSRYYPDGESSYVYRNFEPIHRGCVQLNRITHAVTHELSCTISESLIKIDSILIIRNYDKDFIQHTMPRIVCN